MDLTLTTWNLKGSEGPDIDAVVEHLLATRADVVVLQEVQRHQARAVARGLDAASLGWGFKHWPVLTWPEGMAVIGVSRPVAVRTRALSFRVRFWSWRRRIVQTATVEVAGPEPGAGAGGPAARLTLVNAHLSPHSQEAIRATQVAAMVRALAAAPGPQIVAGDLNDSPGAALFTQFAEAGLRDGWSAVHPGGSEREGATNWRGWTPGTTEPPRRRLDYVLVSPALQVVEASLPGDQAGGWAPFNQLSDHLPLTVTVTVTP